MKTITRIANSLMLICTVLGCESDQGSEEQAPSQSAAQSILEGNTQAETAQWKDVSVEVVELSDPNLYRLNVYLSNSNDRERYELKLTPPLKIKKQISASRSIRSYQLEIGDLKPRGIHSLVVHLQHTDGRVFSKTLEIRRQPMIKVSEEGVISCRLMECSGQLTWSGALKLKVEPKSVVIFGDRIARSVGDEREVNLEQDLMNFLLSNKEIFSSIREGQGKGGSLFSKELIITLDDKTRATYTVQWSRLRLFKALHHVLKSLQTQTVTSGVVFKGESNVRDRRSKRRSSKRPRGLVFFPKMIHQGVERVTDIRWVAFTKEHLRSQDCGAYRNLSSQSTRVITHRYRDLSVEVFDRFSGKRVLKRRFYVPAQDCPKRKPTTAQLSSSIDYDEVYHWVNQQTAKLN